MKKTKNPQSGHSIKHLFIKSRENKKKRKNPFIAFDIKRNDKNKIDIVFFFLFYF